MATFDSFEALLAAARAGQGDCVLTDAWGGASALLDEASRQRLSELGSLLPVILVTASGWASRTNPEELGVAAILPKPFDFDDLLGAIGTALGECGWGRS